MALDFPVDIMGATVQLEQRADGARTTGTGFLVVSKAADGKPEVILVTADHVLAAMPGEAAMVGFRAAQASGSWSFTPQPLRIRDEAGAALWTKHPTQDVAAMRLEVPPEYLSAAIPVGYLASDAAGRAVTPGEELMILGYPKGLAANTAGFPILRAGRVASYPVSPEAFPTFLLDFSVFPGNSGGPVFKPGPRSAKDKRPVILGVLTQQVEMDSQRLQIGVVTHAKYAAETVDLLQQRKIAMTVAPVPAATVQGAVPAAERTVVLTPWRRSVIAAQDLGLKIVEAVVRPFRILVVRYFGLPA